MFDVFRRHQRKWMAAVTIMAMIAFCFPATRFLTGDARRRGKRPDDVVETAFGHKLTGQSIEDARSERRVANEFLLHIRAAVGDPFAMRFPEYVLEQYGFGSSGDEEDLKDGIRHAYKADALGITVSDDMIRAWITQMTGGRLSTEKFEAVVAKSGRDLSAQAIFNILRRQLQIQRVRQLTLGRFAVLGTGSGLVTPYETWQFYRRMHDEFTLEIVPVPVSEFAAADKIADPGDDPLRELYNRYVGQLPDPNSPDPGFKEPRRIHLEYAFVSLEQFVAATEPEVTEDEIKQHYESRKDMYRVPKSLPGEKSESPAEDMKEEKKDENPSPEKDDTAKPGTEEKKETPEKKKDEEQKKDDAKSPTPSTPPDKPDAKGTPEKTEKPTPETDDSEADEPQEPAQPPAEPPAKTNKDDKPSGQEEKPKPEQQPAAKDSEKPKEPAQESTDEPKATTKKDGDPEKTDASDSPESNKDEPPQYKSLEEVTPEIHDSLAREKARKELIKRLEKVQDLIGDFGNTYSTAKRDFDDAKEKDPSLKFQPPPRPNIEDKLNEWNLQFVDTRPTTLEAIAKTEGLDECTELVGESSSGRRLVGLLASRTDDLYDPRTFKNESEESYFAVWKVADEEARQPSFDEIRDQVLARYRLIKARDDAKKTADELAKWLRGPDADLANVSEQRPGADPINIEAVPLWTTPAQFSPSMMSPPSTVQPTELLGVQSPGEDFRMLIFGLKEGEVAVSPNQPQDTYYVIRVAKRKLAQLDEFARSRPIVEHQLQQMRIQQALIQWEADLRREASGQTASAPRAN